MSGKSKEADTYSAACHPRGKASVWIESEVQHFVDCCVAEQRGEKPPVGPPKGIPVRLIRFPEVERMTGLKRGHTSWLIREGKFPPPFKLPATNPVRKSHG